MNIALKYNQQNRNAMTAVVSFRQFGTSFDQQPGTSKLSSLYDVNNPKEAIAFVTGTFVSKGGTTEKSKKACNKVIGTSAFSIKAVNKVKLWHHKMKRTVSNLIKAINKIVMASAFITETSVFMIRACRKVAISALKPINHL